MTEEQIEYFLFEDGLVSGKRYKERVKFWRSTALYSSGYFPNTEQVSLQLMLTKDDEESFHKTLSTLEMVLPFIKPHDDGKKRFGVFEHTLSEYGSYSVEISEGCFDLVVCRWHRKSIEASFDNLSDLVRYVQEHHYYNDPEDDEVC